MHKKIVVMISLSLLLFSGCAVNEKIEEIGNRKSLHVLRWLNEFPSSKVRADVMDEDVIEEVNDVLMNVDWKNDADKERPTPNYQIGNVQIWLPDQASIVHAVNLEEETYAELTEEESEFIIGFIVSVFY